MQRRPPAQESWEFPTDDAAFFDRYGPVIFAYILKHVRSREDAEDLTLEVFTAALEKKRVSQLRPDEQLAWLKRVTHNKLIDAYRKALVNAQWQPQHSSLVAGEVGFFSFVTSQLGWVFTSQQAANELIRTLYRTNDGGLSWHEVMRVSTPVPLQQQGG